MKKKNNKGFTLIEAIATVTIMLLITLIAIPTSKYFIEKGKNTQYEILEDQIISAASKYYIKHKSESCIPLNKLMDAVDDKFIDETKIIDPRNNKELIGVVEVSINGSKVKYELVSGATEICTIDDGEGPAEVPDNVELFYTYTSVTGGYQVGLTDEFKTALNGNTDYIKDGNTLWTAGSALPNPGSTYEGEPVKSMHSMFINCSSLTELDVSNFDTSNVRNMGAMFVNCSSLTELDLSSFVTSNVSNMTQMFAGCSSLTMLDVSNFDTSNVLYMGAMFGNCSSLTTLDVSNFDTSNVTNMNSMFSKCSSLTELDVSNFDTLDVTGMNCMFWGCSSLTMLDVSNFDTSNVNDMTMMFESCSSLTELDLSSFDTSNVIYMTQMFWGCSSLTELDLSSFDTSNVLYMSGMFLNCISLRKLDLSSFDTSNATDMTSSMFAGCKSIFIIVKTEAEKAKIEEIIRSTGEIISYTITVKQ